MQCLGLKMYRPRLLHGLLEDDPDRRLHFCEVVLNDESKAIASLIRLHGPTKLILNFQVL